MALSASLAGPATVTVPASAQWAADAPKPVRAQIRVTPQQSGTPYELFGVSFADALNGHAVGVSGTIVRTADGGSTWAAQTAPVKSHPDGTVEDLTGVSFPDAGHGYAVGSDGSLLATSDGGATWVGQTPPPPLEISGAVVNWAFRGVSFADAEVGAVVGGTTGIITTTDGGSTWTAYGNPRFGSLMAVSSIDRLHAHAAGWSGHAEEGIPFVTIATEDGGRTWEPRAADFGPGVDPLNFNAVDFTDPMHGHAVADGGRIVATADGGRTWKLQRSSGVEVLSGVAFSDARRGVAVGRVTLTGGVQRALVFATDDGGLNWTTRIVPETVRLSKAAFADHDTAYAVGCRADRQDNEPTPHCLDAAIVRIAFLPPPLPQSSGSSWLSAPVVGGAVLGVLMIAVLLGLRRRRALR